MNLVLTFDYELYGDGSGDVFDHIISPTNRILEICNNRGIRCTIFFEVIEYLRLKDEWVSGNKMGYTKNPVKAMEEQIVGAHMDGHDIQLHVHPQWVKASYSDGKWNVDFENWRLGDFQIEEEYTIYKLLKEGKEALETIIRTVDVNYSCSILRAGGYNIVPSKEVYDAMVKLGLDADSSVYPGGYEDGTLSRYDFRDSTIFKDFWLADRNDFSSSSQESIILEIPIYSMLTRRFSKINLERLKSFWRNKRSGIHSVIHKTNEKSILAKLFYLFGLESCTWDFCLFSRRQHRRYFRFIEKNLVAKRSTFVLIGHPKGYTSDSGFLWLINYAFENDYRFVSLKQLYNEVRQGARKVT